MVVTLSPASRFETLQIHAGLTTEAYGCTVPVYNSASFRFRTCADASAAFDTKHQSDHYSYSRISNPTVDVFENRMTALEGGMAAVAFSSGAAAILMAVMTLARSGDNVICSSFVHGGTYHQFKIIFPQMGIETRFVDGANLKEIKGLIDDKTKLIFTESIGNPRFAIPDYKTLTTAAHNAGVPVLVDATFTAAGYFCRPFDHGADIIIHSATKWIGGHGTTLGGVIIDSGKFDWGKNPERFPQLHGGRPGTNDINFSQTFGEQAFIKFLKFEVGRDTGATLSPNAAQQLLIGLETLSLRCQRQASNATILAKWLEKQPGIAWVQYLGLEGHEHHEIAKKYLVRGFGTVLTFGVKGGSSVGFRLLDNFKMIINTPNVGDSKTLVGHHWSTTHSQLSVSEKHSVGVYEDLFRLSVGTEHIDDIIDDFQQSFESLSLSGQVNGSKANGSEMNGTEG